MQNLVGYKIIDTIHEGKKHLIYRCEKGNKKVIIKQLYNEYPSIAELKRIQTEFEILQKFAIAPCITKIIKLEKYKNTLLLIFEDIQGISLDKIIKQSGKLSINDFLYIAINVLKALEEIHKKYIIHKDIKPHNIIYNQDTNKLEIIDFGSASLLSKETPSMNMANILEGTLPYISPEQTGRMNRMVDYRTDFYSLGVTFYQLLTAKLPFDSNDTMELIHYHIAINPEPPQNFGVPKIISDIILKLMNKNAEDRYQSATGVLHDLEKCLENSNNLDAFSLKLGLKDVSLYFQIPEKVHGREKELEQLLNTYEKVTKGSTEIILVNGPSGIGKTALVNEVQKTVINTRGYFLTGKFDPMKRNMPFRAIIYAFQDLVKIILSEKKESINIWKEKLQTALGSNGRVITEVIPELELIIGEQPELVELSPLESQNRFNLVFQGFVKVFAKEEHPLVVFLDDLQWADSPSINLIQSLYTSKDISHLLFVLAYRINEVDAVHPFVLMKNELIEQAFEIEEVSLKPLKLEHVNQLISETLKREVEETKSLAEIIYSKTAGNPFFVNELLQNLYNKDLFHLKGNKWNWEIDKIREANISSNVIDLLVEKAKSLSEEELNILKLISCIGSWFYLDVFYQILEREESLINELLTKLSNNGFISIGENKGKFIHDKIKEAIYGMVEIEEQKVYHYKIGITYLKIAKKRNAVEEYIFTIVNQLNNSINLLSIKEKNELLSLNLMGVNRALASAAYEPALNLVRVLTELLPNDAWEKMYEICLDIYTKRGKTEYLNGNFDEAEKYFAIVLNHAKNNLEKTTIYEIKITLYTSLNRLKEALEIGEKALELLGVTFPKVHDPTQVFTKIFQELKSKRVEDLLDLPMSSEPYQFAIMRLLNSCITPAYLSLPSFLPLVIGKMILISLDYGNFPVSPFAYVLFGNILCSAMGNSELGYAFGKLAMDLVDKYNLGFMKSIIYLVFTSMVSHWKVYGKTNIHYLEEGYQFGVENGNLQWANYCLNHYSIHHLLNRNNLEIVIDKMEKNRIAAEKLKHHDGFIFFCLWQQTAINFYQITEYPISLQSEIFKEKEIIEEWEVTNNSNNLYCFYANKASLCYIYNYYEKGYNFARIAEPHEGGVFGMRVIPELHFFDSLNCLELYKITKDSETDNQVYLDQVQKNQERMKVWATNCEANYGHKYFIIEAELDRIKGKTMEVILDKYDKAIKLAIQYEYTLEEAIANELLAKFWLGQKKAQYARVCIREARYAYERWGCKPKVKQLEEKYPDFIKIKQKSKLTDTTRGKVSTATSSSLDSSSTSSLIDVQSILKASQTLSADLELEKILENIMRILFQNAGAEIGFLILVEETKNGQDYKMTIEAEGDANKNKISVMLHKPLEQGKLPPSILNYVARTKKEVVLDNASGEGLYKNAPFIKENQSKSVMCYPVISKGKLVAVVYLENNLTTHAFTRERIEIMRMLSTQLAISIENSKLINEIVTVTKEKTKVATEMKIANQIQTSLLPKNPSLSGFKITAYMQTADDVGGDYYDVFQDAYGRDWLIIGDVSGHGVPAGLVMMMAQTAIHSVIHKTKVLNLEEMMQSVNRILTNNIRLMDMDKYMTITVFSRITEDTFLYTGLHQSLIVYRAATNVVEVIQTPGFWLGYEDMMNDFDFKEIKFNQGDTLLLYTDGITEARDKNDNMFCDDGLIDFMEKNGMRSTEKIKEELLKVLEDYHNDDDITFMAIKKS